MTEQPTVEQEAAQVLEEMAKLERESFEATEKQRFKLQELTERQAEIVAEINMINAGRAELLANLELQAKDLGLRAERTIKTEHGTITYRSGYLRVSYDNKGLDALVKSPEYEWLQQYRKESSVAASVKVDVVKSFGGEDAEA
jgi:hypothetical protein